MTSCASHHPRWKSLLALFIGSLLIRSAAFIGYVQHEQRYCQPDTAGYHLAALCMQHGFGMKYPNKKPIFWRTPGYPLFLMPWYDTSITTIQFNLHHDAHINALWLQIILCSFVPLLIFAVALSLTQSYWIAWTTALISMAHHGFVLASTFMLTDGLGMIFFLLFLYCLFTAIRFKGETALFISETQPLLPHTPYLMLTLAALTLSAYTWMRPHGQFVAIGAMVLIFFSQGTWRSSFWQTLYFITLFMLTLSPWYVRNYRLTGDSFFCPLFGLYLNVFNAPKIVARTENISLKEAHTKLTTAAHKNIAQEIRSRFARKDPRIVCGENMCLITALSPIMAHPGYFLYDWIVEVLKTTYDLYAYQFVALVNNTFSSDPLVEYLPEKIADTLYEKPLPWYFRTIGWIEFITNILMWIGIFYGAIFFLAIPLLQGNTKLLTSYGYLWIKCCFFVGLVVIQTGGFGYARLRLPIEPLMIIMGLVAWQYIASVRGWIQWKSSTRRGAVTT